MVGPQVRRAILLVSPLLMTFYRHYSLEVVQHPIRARMCGFGDKVRQRHLPPGCHLHNHVARIVDR